MSYAVLDEPVKGRDINLFFIYRHIALASFDLYFVMHSFCLPCKFTSRFVYYKYITVYIQVGGVMSGIRNMEPRCTATLCSTSNAY